MRKLCRVVVSVLALAWGGSSTAGVNCSGEVTTTKVGEYGAQETYLIVNIKDSNGVKRDYRLGKYSGDDPAKARLSLATAALVASKNLMLRFYSYSDCGTASSERAIPNSTYLLK